MCIIPACHDNLRIRNRNGGFRKAFLDLNNFITRVHEIHKVLLQWCTREKTVEGRCAIPRYLTTGYHCLGEAFLDF